MNLDRYTKKKQKTLKILQSVYLEEYGLTLSVASRELHQRFLLEAAILPEPPFLPNPAHQLDLILSRLQIFLHVPVPTGLLSLKLRRLPSFDVVHTPQRHVLEHRGFFFLKVQRFLTRLSDDRSKPSKGRLHDLGPRFLRMSEP